jgi:E3 ubiquitin-protein ligase RNF14
VANYKIGNNNHVLCWSCNQHFCYGCRATVRRGAETRAHFGTAAGKCRQHSAD